MRTQDARERTPGGGEQASACGVWGVGGTRGAELWVWRVPPITDAGVTVAGCGSFVR